MEEYHPPLIWVTDTKFSKTYYSEFDIDDIVRNHPSAIILHTGNINLSPYPPSRDEEWYHGYPRLPTISTYKRFYTLYYIYGLSDYLSHDVETSDITPFKNYNNANLRVRKFVKINDKTLLIGVEGFPDAQYQSTDHLDISQYFLTVESVKEMIQYSIRDAKVLSKKLDKIKDIDNLLIAVHICPFDEPFSNPLLFDYKDKVGMYTSKYLGDAILKFSEDNPTTSIHICCGISALESFSFLLKDNITIHFNTSYNQNKKIRYIHFDQGIQITDTFQEPEFDKVIFLDIDDVINTEEKYGNVDIEKAQREHNKDPIYRQFYINSARLALESVYNHWNPESIKVLQDICNGTNVKIVISSYWRISYTYEELKFFFRIYDLDKYIVGFTSQSYGDRGMEIKHYLDKHPNVKKFVILDDQDDGITRFYEDNYVKIDKYLSMDHLDIIKQHLDL
jgi:hypothetical protein